MPVSGIVLTCAAGSADEIALKIAENSGVEVHGVLADGRIVAVIEADTVDGEVELVTELQGIEGVVSVQLAYHNFEHFEEERS
ncbi:MAG: chaperone NapD [Desulfuromonadales bacterium]|nr:chaperone NapD [Desulfuromonadales bacterium]